MNTKDKQRKRQERKAKLDLVLANSSKAAKERTEPYTRQVRYDDAFEGFEKTGAVKILKPPYSPEKMFEIYEESSVLLACIEAYVENVEGYGHRIVPAEGLSETDIPEGAQSEKQRLTDLFDHPNGQETFTKIRKQLRRDFEVTGNSYLEIVRNLAGEPTLFFWMEAKRVRLCPIDEAALVATTTTVPRNGIEVTIPIRKKFRKFVMVSGSEKKSLRYFKEYGDPRSLNALTGKYPGEIGYMEEGTSFEEATEVIHFRFGNSTYGIPRWIANLLSALGSSMATFVNYDLFDGQAIPPLIITVAGGELTDESFDDLLAMLDKSKGTANFHKILLLQADPTMTTMEGKESVPIVSVTDLMAFRKDDALFTNYLDKCNTFIRKFGFRLPGLFVGETDNISYASAKVSRETTEEQVFIPIRNDFDEEINLKICRALKVKFWAFKSKYPVIKSSEDLLTLLPTVVKSGALTMNELIEFSNVHFQTEIPVYEEKWADLPLPLILYCFQQMGIGGQPMLGTNEVFKPLTEGMGSLGDMMGVSTSPPSSEPGDEGKQ